MPPIPTDGKLDATLAFLRDPYRYVSKTCDRLGSDVFETRLRFRKTVCLRGADAAALFYDTSRFDRQGAVPGRIVKTLFGRGGVQGLDGAAHRHRKAMFLSLLGPDRFGGLVERTAEAWRAAARRWERSGTVVLYDEAREVLARAVCAWAAVPLPDEEIARRTAELTRLFDGAGAVGPRHWASRIARRRADRWAAGIVEDVRAGRLRPPEGSVLRVVADHRDGEGDLLPPHVAGVEIVNVLRPTVALSVWVAFAALALHRHPEVRAEIAADGTAEAPGDAARRFALEVRRFYPFFPAVAARVRTGFEWRGYRLPEGQRVLLDVYGTDHDPRLWNEPEAFRPSRFAGREPTAFDYLPQGGGEHLENHRCPGEWIAIALLAQVARFLALEIEYNVPEQDLTIDFARIPARPRSRFVLADVRPGGRRPG